MNKFVIPGNPSDYYVAIRDEHGIVKYSALRGKIRELVEIYNACIRDVINEGGNPHTANLDMNDVLEAFINKEPPEAQVAFYNMFTQEMDAATSTTIDKTNKLNEETAKNELNAMQLGQWIGAVVLFLIFLAFLMN